MPDDNGWAEYKRLVLAKIDEHGADIKELKVKVSDIQTTVSPISKMAESIELLAKGNTMPKKTNINWTKVLLALIGLISAIGVTFTTWQCSTPNGFNCGAQDVKVTTAKPVVEAVAAPVVSPEAPPRGVVEPTTPTEE